MTSVVALALGAGLAQAQTMPTIAVPELIPAPKCCCDTTAVCPATCPTGCGTTACTGCAIPAPCCTTAASATAKCKCCEDCKCGANCSCGKGNNCCAACDCGKPNPVCAGCCASGAANCCYIYQLKHAQAAKVARIFADFLGKNQEGPKEIEILPNPVCNQLIIHTKAQCLGRLYHLIHELDVPEVKIQTAAKPEELGEEIGCQPPSCGGMSCPAGPCCTSEGCCSANTKKSKHNHVNQPAMIFVAAPPLPGIPMMPPAPPMMMPPNAAMPGIPFNDVLPNPVPMPGPARMPYQMVTPPVAPQPPRPAANVWVLRAITEPAETHVRLEGMKVIQVKSETGRAKLEMQSADAKAICESMTLTCTAFGTPLQITAGGKKVVISGSCLKATCDSLTNMGPDCGMVLKGNVELKYSQGDLQGEVKCDNAALDFAHGTLKLEGCVCLKHVKGDTEAQVKCGNLSIGLEDGKLEIKPSPAP
jgi:hypothetical protein